MGKFIYDPEGVVFTADFGTLYPIMTKRKQDFRNEKGKAEISH